MRLIVPAALVSLLLVRLASAACPGGPDCFGGGGPAATDCIVTWSGITTAATTCVDGSACDQDGAADGVCTFALQACLGADPACGVTGVTSARVTPARVAGTAALQAGIQGLAPGQCTTPGFTVPVKRSAGLGRIKPGVARVKAMVAADGKRDPDALKLTCQPAAPSFATEVQPILTQRCTQGACHSSTFRSQDLVLDAGAAYASLVGRRSTEGGTLLLVAPGNVARSFMARKVLGKGLKAANGSLMPQGCPGFPPAGGCLTDAEIYTILAWIQAGAPNS